MKNNFLKKIIEKRMYRVNKNSGFTLVESLFAVMTLTFTITILMSVVSTSLFSSRYSKDEITVSYLMQEVVDYIRNDRDTSVFLSNGSWDNFYSKYSKCSSSSGGCYFAIEGGKRGDITSCSSDCPLMYFDKDASYGSFYNYKPTNTSGISNTITSMKRKIIVDKNPTNNDEIEVTVNITWKNGGSNLERNLKASITNWR